MASSNFALGSRNDHVAVPGLEKIVLCRFGLDPEGLAAGILVGVDGAELSASVVL